MRTRIFTSVSGIGIKYKHSMLSDSVLLGNFPDDAPEPGERLPNLAYKIGGKFNTLCSGLNPHTFHLFVFGKLEIPASFQLVLDKYNDVISVKYIANESGNKHLFKSLGLENEGCYLVRPDLYIAWRSHELNAVSLGNYLQKFLI